MKRGSAKITGYEPNGQQDVFLGEFRRLKQKEPCSGHGVFYAHKTGKGSHGWVIPDGTCNLPECENPHCRNRYTKERANRIRKTYLALDKAIKGVSKGVTRYGALVFTLPKSHRTADPEKLKTLRKLARNVAERWLLAVNGLDPGDRRWPGWSVAGVDCWHPEGDENPGVWAPHIHMQVPLLAHSVAGFRRLRAVVPVESLDLLRWLWGGVLNHVLGWVPPGRHWERCSVDYKWVTPLVPGQVRHRIRYDFRHWPTWAAGWRSIRWWGWLSPRSKKNLGIILEDPLKLQTHPAGCCPLCGAVAEYHRTIGSSDLHGGSKHRRSILERSGAPPWAVDCELVSCQPVACEIWED